MLSYQCGNRCFNNVHQQGQSKKQTKGFYITEIPMLFINAEEIQTISYRYLLSSLLHKHVHIYSTVAF